MEVLIILMAGVSFCCFIFVKIMKGFDADARERLEEIQESRKKLKNIFNSLETQINNPPEFSYKMDPLKFDCVTNFFKELEQYCQDLSGKDLVTGESVQKKIIELCAKNFQNQEVENDKFG